MSCDNKIEDLLKKIEELETWKCRAKQVMYERAMFCNCEEGNRCATCKVESALILS
jgi:hypothetical protein